MSKRQLHWPRVPVIVAVVVFGALLRLVVLDHFPEIEADEGLWTNSSKNYALFGDWFMDGRTHMLLSPVFHVLSVAVFRVMGASIAHARLISGIAGALSIVLVFILLRRLTSSRDGALIGAALFAVSEWTVVLSRRALIEPLQLFWILAAAVLLSREERWATPAAGLMFAIALLTKINAAFLLPIFALFIILGLLDATPKSITSRLLRAGVFAGAAVTISALVYYALYRYQPELFARAYSFELAGRHFSGADPIVRVGRFGFDPVYSGRTAIALFREDPFLFVLASLGIGIAITTRTPGALFFGIWALAGTGFVFGQLFQPLRYLYLTAPAYVYFAALPIVILGRSTVEATLSRPARAALVICMLFETAYLAMNAVANRAEKLHEVRSWADQTLDAADRVIAAGYFCTDLPVRAYAHYHLAATPAQLVENIRKLGITYVIYDDAEWHPQYGRMLAENFERVAEWSFGVAYRVDGVAQQGVPTQPVRQ